MAKDFIGYEDLTDRALRGVVRAALARVQKQGLIGSHHFYLTFKTRDPGVSLPEFLKERYPDEMTIVLQNQFSGLKVSEDGFEVTLSFQKVPATIFVPFSALTAFVDPGVQFGLQFRNATAARASLNHAPEREQKPAAPLALPPAAGDTPPEPKPDGPRVVSLDKFRKK